MPASLAGRLDVVSAAHRCVVELAYPAPARTMANVAMACRWRRSLSLSAPTWPELACGDRPSRGPWEPLIPWVSMSLPVCALGIPEINIQNTR